MSSPSQAQTRPVSSGLFRFAVFTALFTLGHIKLGGMVTSTGSGMAFEDWPLSNGSLWPPGMFDEGEDGSKALEHVHRATGTLVGIWAIVLLVWIYRVDPRRWLRRLAWGFLAVVTIQGVLGGLGVVLSPDGIKTWEPAVIGHGILAQPTLCLAAFMAFALSMGWNERLATHAVYAQTARRLAGLAFGLVFVQIAVGAVVRHANIQGMLWLHVFMAIAVSIGIMISTAYNSGKFAAQSRGFRVLGRWVWILLSLQLLLGFVTLIVRRPKDPSNIEFIGRSLVATAHVAIGATLFVMTTLLLARTWRTLYVPDVAQPSSGAAA